MNIMEVLAAILIATLGVMCLNQGLGFQIGTQQAAQAQREREQAAFHLYAAWRQSLEQTAQAVSMLTTSTLTQGHLQLSVQHQGDHYLWRIDDQKTQEQALWQGVWYPNVSQYCYKARANCNSGVNLE